MPEAWQREPVACYFTDFDSLIELAYPVYVKLTEEQKNAYKNYVNAINPELEIKNAKFIYSEDILFCLPDPEIINN